MTEIDLFIHGATSIVTCAGPAGAKRGVEMLDPGSISDGAVAVSGGVIVDVGQTDEIARKYSAKHSIDASGRVILPGFVDPHTHAVFAGDRIGEFEQRIRGAGYLDILAAGGGIHSTTRATRRASAEELIHAALPRLKRMLALGATTVEVKTGYGLDLESELKLLAVIAELDRLQPIDLVPTFMPAHAVPPEFTDHPDRYVDLIVDEMLPAAADWYRSSRFAGVERPPLFVDVFCERNAFDLAQSARVLEAGAAYGMAVKAHVDEFTNLGGVGLALSLGAVSIDHLDAMTDDEKKQLAASPTVAVITPAVNFNLGSAHYADARGLIDAGAAVALTTDYNPGSAPCFSMPLVMGIACRYCRMTPAEAISASTINAAHAVGMGARVGSIEPGKLADLLIADISDIRQLAYELGGNPIETVIKSGQVVCAYE